MIADTLELYRRFTGEETFQKIIHYPSLTDMWEARSKEYSDRIAIEDLDKQYSYQTLSQDVACFRTVLKEQGVEKTRIALCMPNCYDLVKAFLATVTLGCTAVILPPHLQEKELFGLSQMLRFSMLITDHAEKGNLLQKMNPAFPVILPETTASEATPSVPCEGKDECVIMMTGGTTGRPKGALLSHTAVMQGSINSCLGLPKSFGQRYLLVLPLFHVFGLIRNLMASLYTGSTLKICRDNKDMFRDAAVFQPTIMIMVPALAEMTLALSKKFGKMMLGNSLHTIICGAASVPPYLTKEYQQYGIDLYPGYGLTESANLVSGNPEFLNKPDSVGLIYPEMEYRIVDGELWLKGKNMMDGYVGTDETDAYEDGWFKTGDLVRMDEEGFLYITGRIKEVIVLPSGENISPAELEAKFNALPIIQDTQVFEDQDEKGNRFLALEIVLRASEAAKLGTVDVNAYVLQECQKINAGLPSFQQVSRMVIREKDFERTPSLKIVRYKNVNE